MRIAILADIHGNIIALEKVLEDIKNQEINDYIILGDIVMIGPDPAAAFRLVKTLKPLSWIKGNTDMWLEEFRGVEKEPEITEKKPYYEFYLYAKERMTAEEIDILTSLPEKASLNIAGCNILCVHGSPRSATEEMDYRLPEAELAQMLEGVEEDIVLCAHSHIPYLGLIRDKHVFNVGSVGRPLDGNIAACYGILDLGKPHNPEFFIQRVAYPVNETIRRAKESGLPLFKRYEYTLANALFS
jgi:putative phosphoesterase